MATRAAAKVTTDHEEIRRWAEERGAKPACVRGTGGGDDTGMIRLDFPGFSGRESLQHIRWDEWFRKFDESGLALLHQDTTARGQKSNFNKLISRETAKARGAGDRKANRRTAGTRGAASAAKRTARGTGVGSRSARGSSRSERPTRATGSANRRQKTTASSRQAEPSRGKRKPAGTGKGHQSTTIRTSGRTRGAEPRVTTDHDEIRRWAEERGGRPACVKGTGGKGDIGMLRLDFPGYSGAQSLQPIGWDDWFEKFDERGLALLHQEQTARGQQSNFNKLISRETARRAQRTAGSRSSKRAPQKVAKVAKRSEPAAKAKGPSRVTKKTARRSDASTASRKAGRIGARKGSVQHRRAA